MITYSEGNLLEAGAEALVNTVNTVGVMGKGIALMFKERFDDNYQRYGAACNARQVHTGRMFVTEPTMRSMVRDGLARWPAGAGERNNRLFDDRAIGIALERLTGEQRQPMAA